jgi:hypothetical protein
MKERDLNRCTVANTADAFLRIAETPDATKRLHLRETLIFNGQSFDTIITYVLNGMRNVEGIRAYVEWEKHDKPFRKKFYRTLAQSAKRKKFAAIKQGIFTSKVKNKLYHALIKPIRTKHC